MATCYWCGDEEAAQALMVTLCSYEKNKVWRQKANPCLCSCDKCVTEYHKLKDEYLEVYPQHEKILYEIEVERLTQHLSSVYFRCHSNLDPIDASQIIVEDFRVSMVEVLQYPYLLFNEDVMAAFLKCLMLMISFKNWGEITERYPGIYLLLFNPNRKKGKAVAVEEGYWGGGSVHQEFTVVNST
eukprot:gene7695-8532_t